MKRKNNELKFDGLDEIMVAPMKDGEPYYNVRAIDDYCKKYNRKSENLTEKELKQFITGIHRKDANK